MLLVSDYFVQRVRRFPSQRLRPLIVSAAVRAAILCDLLSSIKKDPSHSRCKNAMNSIAQRALFGSTRELPGDPCASCRSSNLEQMSPPWPKEFRKISSARSTSPISRDKVAYGQLWRTATTIRRDPDQGCLFSGTPVVEWKRRYSSDES